MFYGLNKFIKNILPKRLFYRSLIIVAAPIIILQITISVVFFDSLWIKTNKGMTKSLVSEVYTFVEAYKSEKDYNKQKLTDLYYQNFELIIKYIENETVPVFHDKRWYSPIDRTLRRELKKKGAIFKSENDTEVAAGYISNSLSNDKSLKDTLTSGLKDLDGFYTFIAGTRKGFAVVRDEIACKPAVIAETKNYVAIASEFQAMAHLPDVNGAKIFEPEPGIVYSWGN